MAADCAECGKAAKHEPDCPALARIKRQQAMERHWQWERDRIAGRHRHVWTQRCPVVGCQEGGLT